MLRVLGGLAVAAAVVTAVSCGGNAFSTAPGDADSGNDHEGSVPPPDTGATDGGSPADVITPMDAATPLDAITPVDATGEPPPTCSGAFTCVPAVPSGWDGPLEVYAGMGAPPSCSVGFAQSVGAYDMLQAPDATCSCACGPSMTTCTAPNLGFYDGMTCNATPMSCGTVILTPGACTTIDQRSHCTTSSYLDVTVFGGSWTAGACAPEPTNQVPPYSWTDQMRGCASTVAPAQVDCQMGQVCAPRPESGFDPKLCISHAGDVPCPGNGYGVKRTFYTAVDDMRACTACSCGSPNGGSCSFAIDAYLSSDQSCSGSPDILMPGARCAGAQQPGDFRLVETPTGGTCTPGASVPSGSATPTGPVTVCCPL